MGESIISGWPIFKDLHCREKLLMSVYNMNVSFSIILKTFQGLCYLKVILANVEAHLSIKLVNVI